MKRLPGRPRGEAKVGLALRLPTATMTTLEQLAQKQSLSPSQYAALLLTDCLACAGQEKPVWRPLDKKAQEFFMEGFDDA